MDRNRLFLLFVRALFIILLLYGMGMVVVVLVGDPNLALKMLNAFAAMFSGMLGLGAGYLLGGASNPDKPPEQSDDKPK